MAKIGVHLDSARVEKALVLTLDRSADGIYREIFDIAEVASPQTLLLATSDGAVIWDRDKGVERTIEFENRVYHSPVAIARSKDDSSPSFIAGHYDKAKLYHFDSSGRLRHEMWWPRDDFDVREIIAASDGPEIVLASTAKRSIYVRSLSGDLFCTIDNSDPRGRRYGADTFGVDAADIDGDGRAEVVSSNLVFEGRFRGTPMTRIQRLSGEILAQWEEEDTNDIAIGFRRGGDHSCSVWEPITSSRILSMRRS